MLISNFHKTISLNNLKGKSFKGQVATLLIFFMVATLILILVTVNLGNVSILATKLSNAADSAALLLGSQLSSRANQLWASFNYTATQRCKKGGLLGVVFALAAAIFTGGTSLAAYAFAGAMGGALGNLIVYGTTQGALQGFVQGAVIGLAIGYATITTQAAVANPTQTAVLSTSGSPIVVGPTAQALASLTVPTAISFSTGMALVTASTLYNAVIADRQDTQVFTAVARNSIAGLEEYDRYRENVFFQGLSMVIDDPNTTFDVFSRLINPDPGACRFDGTTLFCDDYDSDRDGDTVEAVPYFQYWWDRRITYAKGAMNIPALINVLNPYFFIRIPPPPYFESLQNIITMLFIYDPRNISDIDKDGNIYEVPDKPLEGPPPPDKTLYRFGFPYFELTIRPEGRLVRWLYYFWNDPASQPSIDPFYKPDSLADANAIRQWEDAECGDPLVCPERATYDEVDKLIYILEDAVLNIEGLKSQTAEYVARNWKYWINFFYMPDDVDPATTEDDEDYYDLFNVLVNGDGTFLGLIEWRNRLRNLWSSLPVCAPVTPPGATTVPCRTNVPYVAYYDDSDNIEDLDRVIGTNPFSYMEFLINTLIGYRVRFQSLYNALSNVPEIQIWVGGKNPVTYSWTDALGDHSVTAQASDFKIPRIGQWSSGNFLKKKKCVGLRDHRDLTGARTWVRITRRDPARRPAGILGTFNPFDNTDNVLDNVALPTVCSAGDSPGYSGCNFTTPATRNSAANDRIFSVSRVSRAYFTEQDVGVAGRTRP